MKSVRVGICVCAALSLATAVAHGQAAMGDDAVFGFGVRPGVLHVPDADGFTVDDYPYYWYIDGENMVGADLFARLYVLPFLGFEGHGGWYGGDDVWMDLEGVDMLLILPLENFRPYAKAGGITGRFDWDGPGDFDRGYGFEAGVGMEVLFDEEGHFGVTTDILYHDLENDYDPEWADPYYPSSDTLDLSGVTFQIGVLFRF